MTQEINNRSKKHKKKKKKLRWSRLFITVFFLFILSVAGYLYSIYGHAKETVDEKMTTDVESIDVSETKDKLESKDILNILILGVDERSEDRGRSDSIMVMSLNPKNETTSVISIPRDTLAKIAGKGTETKINHAYAYGGSDMAVATVENYLDIDLDYFVELNMEGTADLIDAIGGITVNNQIDWIDEGYYKAGYHWKKGEIQLDGAKAMGYIRMRHYDPRGDFGRTERQRQVISAIIDKGKNMATVTKINNIIDVLGDNLQTNMQFSDMKSLLVNYIDVTKNVQSYMLQGEDKTIDGVYYYKVSEEELQKVHDVLIGRADMENLLASSDTEE